MILPNQIKIIQKENNVPQPFLQFKKSNFYIYMRDHGFFYSLATKLRKH